MRLPVAFHLYPAEAFPITIRLISGLDGSELWSRTVQKPDTLGVVEIPGYGGTEHVPVRAVIHFADGTEQSS